MPKKILVGTSGYVYPHWKNIFYPKGIPQRSWLQFYAQHFSSVELNVTFYRLPSKKTFQDWYKKTPKEFKFVIKGSRFITHIKKLRDCKKPLQLFFEHAQGLKNKLLCVLWQLPPSSKYDYKKLSEFIKLLTQYAPSVWQSFEFRHSSWFNQSTYDALKENDINLCIADSASFPCYPVLTNNLLYLRFHGGKTLYDSEYSLEELDHWAQRVIPLSRKIKLLLAFFNNDAHGFAIKNAQQFNTMLHETL
jgi:uncharacterized protein YecE (DUF72 family)